jgi:hypothetical protein
LYIVAVRPPRETMADTRNEDHHDVAINNIQCAGGFVEAKFEKFRYGEGAASHVDRHHAESEEKHSG